MSQEIEKLLENGLIEKTKSDYIKQKFQEFTQIAEEWSKKANSIVVTDVNQKELIAEAKEGRKLLKSKRIEVEKVRKSLKEQSLTEGKLIDSVAKYLTSLIEPAEKHLENQERFKEIQEQLQRQKIKEERTTLLLPYKEVIDPSSIQLDLITHEAFKTILNGAKYALDNKKAEALKAEEEAKELELKKTLFQERRLKVVELKEFYDSSKDIILTLDTKESDFDLLISNLKKRKDKYLAKQAKILKENEKLKKQAKKNKLQITTLQEKVKSVQEQSKETFVPEDNNNLNVGNNFSTINPLDIEVKDEIVFKNISISDSNLSIISKPISYSNVSVISKSITDTNILDFLEQIMTSKDNYCEVYLAGLRDGNNDATAFQFETNPERIPVINKPSLREAIIEAMNFYNK